MTKEKLDEHMKLFESLEKLLTANIVGKEDYYLFCAEILEKMYEEYIKGDPLDKVY